MVGKLNVPKLANFEQVDLFTIVTCPAHTLIDDREYPKPVMAPFELLLGLQRMSTLRDEPEPPPELNLRALLHHPLMREPERYVAADEEATLSLVSGRLVTLPTTQTAQPSQTSTAVAVSSGALTVAESGAVARLQAQTFRGLDPGKEGVEGLVQGLKGLPRHYASEPTA
eukprot:NODE_1074_length_1294_cov_52.964659_g883_i0.p2 GENE.NODE_1074_length_1294_cov_52.964659_g883_i0~~NODE_1074_length_1294_cov_52.964659_g883_i0.p2  ORF type:complete len:170 (-),score=52.14 NODE_1074_length_1294_cov_52.964659_g883_i0:53-562(-)